LKEEKGFALILTLMVIGILAVLVIEFNYLMRVEASIAGNYRRNLQALYLAKAGVNLAVDLIREEDENKEADGIISELPYSGSVMLGEGEVRLKIVDESGKININYLKDKEGKLVRKRADQMLKLCDLLNEQYDSPLMGYGIVPAIVDWVDSDDEVEFFEFVLREREGAEEDYYQSLENPYHCKNKPFDTVGELGLVRGVSEEVLYGRKSGEEEEIEATAGLAEYVTVYGKGKVNINTAPLKVIQSLDEMIDEILAQDIIEYREARAFREVSELKDVKGISKEIYERVKDLITTEKSAFFSVKAEGVVGEARREIRAVVAEGMIIYWRVEG